MAQGDSKFSLAKLNFFSRLDARARVFFLFGSLIGIIFLVYLGTRLLSGSSDTTGPSKVASAPSGLQSVPGGQQTPEFSRAVEQASAQRAQQAQLSGSSAIPTLQGVGLPRAQMSDQCVICSDEAANVKDDLNDWVKEGKVTPEVVKQLETLAGQQVTEGTYAVSLDDYVKAGKLTPDQSRRLLEVYSKQHKAALLNDSAAMMDGMIKSGTLPTETANQLLTAQKGGITTTDYNTMLQGLNKQGKISAGAAQQLLTQYTQQRAKEIVMGSILILHQMEKAGEITAPVEKELVGLENRMVSMEVYSSTLDRLVTEGKITPAVSAKILEEYKSQKTAIGPTGTLDALLGKAEADADNEINDLLKQKQMSDEVAVILRGMIKQDVSLNDFINAVNALVQQNKLTPEVAKLKIADYQAIKGYRDASKSLGTLQANNAPAPDYANELKRLVQQKALSPEQAAVLMQEYLATINRAPVVTAGTPSGNTDAFVKLQERIQQGSNSSAAPVSIDQFGTAETTEDQKQAQQAQQDRIQALISAMSGQAESLVSSWQAPAMAYKAGSAGSASSDKDGAAAGGAGASSSSTTTSTTSTESNVAPLIKSGTILFAVLDTEVNSDYPDSPVMATIVEGKFKGAKLLGKMVATKGVAGQLDRVSLNFTLMNDDNWLKSKTVTAYAIDPDKARTVLASNVNYHYLQRFGAIMATSFMQGYSSAITNAGTSTTGIFGTSTTHPSLSPANKIAVGIGQVGTNLSAITQNYINIPPTVRVDSGVGLGILFMSDVS